MHRSETLSLVCSSVSAGDLLTATNTLANDYPFIPLKASTRKYNEMLATRIFVRDKFIDRYTGEPLVFPASLRLLSLQLPEAFPYHPNWKMSETHPAYWRLCATLDHVVPVTRDGGDNSDSNLVTTSMIRNSAKAQWQVEELGWQMHDPEPDSKWDGLMSWFISEINAKPQFLKYAFAARWYAAAVCNAA
jgi:hypothetical protein